MTVPLALCVLVALLAHGSHAFTTTPYDGCMYNGRHYYDQEVIEKDPENCYGMYCDGHHVLAWDAACFFGTSPCAGTNVDVPGQCCPECIETTTPTTTTPTTEPPGCYVNGSYYAFDSEIPQTDPCKSCTCTRENGVMCAVASCGYVMCVDPVKKKTDCCASCPDGPNCWYGKRKIKVGETYSPTPNMECVCPDQWDPLATCRKLPASKSFLRRKLKRQGSYMNPLLKEYIEKYLNL